MDPKNNYYLSDLNKDTSTFFVNLNEKYDCIQSEQIQNTLVEYIFRQPFQCLKLLDSLATQNKWLQFTVEIKILALQKFIENCVNEEDILRFINFIVNLELPDTIFENWVGKIINVFKNTDDTIYMGLIANHTFDLYMISHNRSLNKANNYFMKDDILFDAIKNNVHFVSQAVQKQNTFTDVTNNYIRNALILAKTANEFNIPTKPIDKIGNIKKMLESFDMQVASEIQILFFNDLRRLQNSIDFLRKHTSSIISVQKLIETNGILAFLYEHTNIMFIGYEEIRQVIESNHILESQSTVLKQMKYLELETITYFFVLAAVYDTILNRRNINESGHKSTNSKMYHIKVMFRQIRNMYILCSLIEDIFHLIFLRWDNHLQSSSIGEIHENQRKKSISSEMETYVELNSVLSRHGFICGGTALKCIFAFLKTFVTKKLHSEEYKTCSESIQRRFTRIMDCINDALWKYSVLEKISDTDTDNFQMEPEDLLQLVQLHKETIEKTSSDDESRERKNFASLARRKARKRRRATFGGGDQQRNEDFTNKDIASSDLGEVENRKSIIPNMLSTPENLAIMALAMKHFNDVKYIIQTFNLHNTELDRELKFVENQQQTKKKLEIIYECYLQQEMKTKDSIATVEQIKKAAAKGFEASKITSIIDNFTHANIIEPNADILALIEKYSSTYSFLLNYEAPNIQTVIAVDLILDLNINYDIISNIIPVIKRRCNIQKLSNSAIANSGLPSEMGCLNFLDNISECMRLMKTIARTEIGLRNMLCDSSYSLRPKKIILELQREKNFQNVFYKNEADLHRIEDLKLLASDFTDFKSKCNYFPRFLSYVANLSKFLHIRDKNTEFDTSALLRFDPSDVIGELIFEEGMTPLEIESHVVALNLNLVHVIALNICPEICDKEPKNHNYKITEEKYQSVFNYIANQNTLLEYILQKIKGSSQSLNINDEYLQRLVKFPSIKNLSEIYEGNKVIAALLSTKVNKVRIKKLQRKDRLFEILQSFEDQLQHEKTFQREKDRIIADLVAENAKYVYLAEHISDINVRASLIYANFTKVSNSQLAKELTESTLLHKDAKYIDKDLKNKLERTLKDINIYSNVSSVLEFESWPQAYDFGLKTPNMILENLLSQGQFKLCYAWCKVVRLGTSFSHQTRNFFSTFLDVLVNLREDFDMHLLQTIETFPTNEVYNFYDTHKEKFRSVNLLNYVVDFLWKNAKNTTYLKNYKVSLKIFEQLSVEEREQNWNLLSRPLLIVEQLIMNCKFKGLAKVLDSIRPLLEEFQTDSSSQWTLCKFCFDKRGNIYDIHSKNSSNFTLGNESSSAFILLNFNLYQKDHVITSECVDLLLRIYATKALDYQIREVSSSSEGLSQSTDMASLDSLCGAFIMPKTPPKREEWVKDDEAVHCMCCRRAVFTMLMRRHHCRRCGRVVCFACSSHRMQIPELYEDVAVRVCSDCTKQTQDLEAKNIANKSLNSVADRRTKCSGYKDDDCRWKLSGNITHDKLLREEFCYEHAPSVALCLSILSYHTNNRKCVDLLLYHCGKLEKLLVPNPEVDYELIAKMMNCLALAAKVRGGPPEVETIREHSDIIMSVVQNGCETLIPAGSLDNHNLRKLADSLVQVEKWQLALEIHWKCGFPTAGVMAAHGLACLRAGCFETARDKFSHCMTKLSSEKECSIISKLISDDGENCGIKSEIPVIKRPSRSPPLLQEILKTIESVPSYKSQPETMARANIIRNSSTSLSSMLSRRREHIPLHEPAINILNTLANLKRLSKGNYCDNSTLNSLDNKKQLMRQSRIFEECIHYLFTYGSHSDIINFFISYEEINAALKYFIHQRLDADIFIHHIFLVFLKTGSVGELIGHMLEIDERLVVWKDVIIGTCRYLETKNLYHCLYELQTQLKDPVRASMTCVKFYSMHCQTYQELYANSFHLHNAHRHLQSELEHSQWENMKSDRKRRVPEGSFLMQMDAKTINAHINTILRQMDVTKFLSQCEQTQPLDNGRLITDQILKQIRIDSPHLPTLFDSTQEKTQICILVLLSGKNIEEGFGLAYRIIQNYKLPSMKVFGATAKYLARNKRLTEVEKLLNCITSNNGTSHQEIDEILTIAINSATNNHEPEVKTTLDTLAKKINSVELRISSHIFIGQLKTAYLLAIQYNRLTDIRKILRQAEATNQVHIKKLCEKKLNICK